MRSSSSRRQRPPLAVIGAAVAFACFALFPRAATPELRPLVRDMLETLRAINEIGESVALEDYSGVRRAAKELEERAGRLRELDLKELGLEPARDAEFDAYLAAQARAAAAHIRGDIRIESLGDPCRLDRIALDLEGVKRQGVAGASDDYREAVASFFEKRKPVFRGR